MNSPAACHCWKPSIPANIDLGADVADTVPLFTQAAGAKLAYIAEESASPSAQAILVSPDSPIKTLADLKGK